MNFGVVVRSFIKKNSKFIKSQNRNGFIAVYIKR